MNPSLIKNWMPSTKSESPIEPSAHHPALFLIQDGMLFVLSPEPWVVGGTCTISSLIKNWIPWTKSESPIEPSAHHPALFLIQSGILLFWETDVVSLEITSNEMIATVVFEFPYWALTLNVPSLNFSSSVTLCENVPSTPT